MWTTCSLFCLNLFVRLMPFSFTNFPTTISKYSLTYIVDLLYLTVFILIELPLCLFTLLSFCSLKRIILSASLLICWFLCYIYSGFQLSSGSEVNIFQSHNCYLFLINSSLIFTNGDANAFLFGSLITSLKSLSSELDIKILAGIISIDYFVNCV